MSHFTVLVIGDNHEEKLQPFHEFECTGENDQYIKDIEKIDEAREEYKGQEDRVFEAPDGSQYDYYADRFYRPFTKEEEEDKIKPMGTGCSSGMSWISKDWGDGKGYKPRAHFIPEGFIEKQIPTKETFLEFIQGYYGNNPVYKNKHDADIKGEAKYGYVIVNDNGEVTSVIDRTNPNAKWDWYQVGGRWSGQFILKDGAKGEKGQPSLIASMQNPSKVVEEAENKKTCDQATFGDIDWLAMKGGEDRIKELSERWDKLILGKEEHQWYKPEYYLEKYKTKEKFIELETSFSTWAVILEDGTWCEKGSMGWWATSDATPDRERDWDEAFYTNFLEPLLKKPETLLTVVDCHI